MMCGFFGFVDFSGNITQIDYKEVCEGALAINYRGPDDSSFLARPHLCLAFDRLSIIDLSAPSQPYVNENDNVIMVCNGEIYNYLELRSFLLAKKHVFKTKTDSEVILHGYEEFGSALWGKLNGIFSIALWDERKKKLFLVRDHLGVKPMHYMVVKDRIYFGSDYNAFHKQSRVKLEQNPNAILSYLSFRCVIGEQTFYKHIKDVLPGQSNVFSVEGESRECYWDIPVDEEKDRGESYYLDKLDKKLSSVIERQLMSDVPLGAFISGGLDSSMLLYYLAKKKEDIKTYITGFRDEDYNEFSYAELMTSSLGINPIKLLLDEQEYKAGMEDAISYRGEPLSVPHELAFLKMSRLMKKNITVVLSGEGADELFAGYGRIFRSPFDYYKQRKINSVPGLSCMLSPIFKAQASKQFFSPMEHFLWRYSWFTEDDKNNLLNLDFFENRYFDEYSISYIKELFNKTGNNNYYRAMYYILGKIHLVNLLNRLDRMTMAASVEARVPFLDFELVEMVSRMPLQYKLRWNGVLPFIKALFSDSEQISEKYDTPKYILKRLAEGKIPKEIIRRKKMGFPVPLNSWFNKEFKVAAIELLIDPDSKTGDFINKDNLKKFLYKDNYTSKYDYDGKKIWMLMNLEIWMRRYF
ncbi:MAG: asparagine synthase (glutamine-hydrolyzing) [Candidatus Omnitrophica bacterium]|nr:asparagine synthase (glutamine-hydrolyzing) [Candidatus Omnitrophota bacterium]